MTKQDLEQAGVNKEILDGISFALEHLDIDDSFAYAEDNVKNAVSEAGGWVAIAKRELDKQ